MKSNIVRIISPFATVTAWFFLHLFLLILSFSIAWGFNASNGFFYSYWYDFYELEKTIDHYSLQNRYKKGFEKTNKKERVRLFDGIVSSIHKSGKGLTSLSYYDSEGNKLGRLLRIPEVQHLTDVALLIDRLMIVTMIILILIFSLVILLKRLKLPYPSPLKLLIPATVILIASGLIIAIVGPKQLFYWLHVQIFTADHQWFFYYQESLMSTMMKAPVIFSGIAIAISGTAFFILLFIEFLLFQWLHRR